VAQAWVTIVGAGGRGAAREVGYQMARA